MLSKVYIDTNGILSKDIIMGEEQAQYEITGLRLVQTRTIEEVGFKLKRIN